MTGSRGVHCSAMYIRHKRQSYLSWCYIDVGCTFSEKGFNRLNKYLKIEKELV